jgi:hypothetical protein
MDLNRVVRMCLISLAAVMIASAQQVEVTPDGQHVLHLSTAQQEAVGNFLRLHPAMRLVGCQTMLPTNARPLVDATPVKRALLSALGLRRAFSGVEPWNLLSASSESRC